MNVALFSVYVLRTFVCETLFVKVLIAWIPIPSADIRSQKAYLVSLHKCGCVSDSLYENKKYTVWTCLESRKHICLWWSILCACVFQALYQSQR